MTASIKLTACLPCGQRPPRVGEGLLVGGCQIADGRKRLGFILIKTCCAPCFLRHGIHVIGCVHVLLNGGADQSFKKAFRISPCGAASCHKSSVGEERVLFEYEGFKARVFVLFLSVGRRRCIGDREGGFSRGKQAKSFGKSFGCCAQLSMKGGDPQG